eukprot:2814804-Pleurochrysis_carterae.AAC.2
MVLRALVQTTPLCEHSQLISFGHLAYPCMSSANGRLNKSHTVFTAQEPGRDRHICRRCAPTQLQRRRAAPLASLRGNDVARVLALCVRTRAYQSACASARTDATWAHTRLFVDMCWWAGRSLTAPVSNEIRDTELSVVESAVTLENARIQDESGPHAVSTKV